MSEPIGRCDVADARPRDGVDSGTRSPVSRATRALAAVVLDGALVAGGASILWHSGGRTVVDGIWVFQVGCLVLTALLLLARTRVVVADVSVERVAIGVEAAALVAWIAIWLSSQLYFVGWLATYGALVLAIASMWQLLAVLLTRPTPAPERDARLRGRRVGGSLASSRATSVCIGLAALLVLAPVHGWNPAILSGLVVLISGAVFLAFAMRTWITALVGSP